jgi:hypothetical protein
MIKKEVLTVVEREGQVDEELITGGARLVMLLDDVVDVGDQAAHEERQHESDDIVSTGPNIDVNGVEEAEGGEAPADTVDDDSLAVGGKLVDDGTEKEEVDERPDREGPRGGGDVGLLAGRPRRGPGDGVDVGAYGSEGVNAVVITCKEETNLGRGSRRERS